VRYATPFKRQKHGLVTTWLASLAPAPAAARAAPAANGAGAGGAAGASVPRVPVWVERGSLRMPGDPGVPLLLVGPGTGVAPFRSFLWQRAAAAKQQRAQAASAAPAADGAAEAAPGGGAPPAPCVLFFGCRHPERDFYYSDEWRELQAAGALDAEWGLAAAFSRPGGGGGKEYVTHKLKQHGARVWRLLAEGGGAVYISGSAQKMPSDVAAALEAVAAAHGGLAPEAAAKWVRQLETSGRYFVEAWS
jgi:sulfite reductase alpha subunit-like flavoprotein